MELELKLAMTPEALRRLERAGWVDELSAERASTVRLYAVYYDTPERALRQAGLTFRVRREGRRWVQCVKGAAGADSVLLTREEQELESAGPKPELAWLAGVLGERLPTAAVLALAPVFVCRVQRKIRLLELPGGSRVELAFDRGTIAAGERTAAVSEVELELAEGEPARLLELAERVIDTVPCRLGTVGKADRGYALADGETPSWQPLPRLRLPADASLEAALVNLLQAMIRQVQAHEETVLAGSHPEGVHQMRVAVRRLRSVLTLLKRLLPAEPLGELIEELRWLARQLGPARDWDVFLAEFLAPVEAAMPELPGLAELARRSRRQWQRAYGRARAAVRHQRYARLLLRLAGWAGQHPWRNQPPETLAVLEAPASELAGQVLARRHRRTLEQGRGFKRLEPAARHQVRIKAKKLRYAAEFLAMVYPSGDSKRYLGLLSDLQQELGRANDVAVAEGLLAKLAGGAPAPVPMAAGVAIGWQRRGLADREGELLRAWKRFRQAKPFWE